jgi:hypothetical protein
MKSNRRSLNRLHFFLQGGLHFLFAFALAVTSVSAQEVDNTGEQMLAPTEFGSFDEFGDPASIPTPETVPNTIPPDTIEPIPDNPSASESVSDDPSINELDAPTTPAVSPTPQLPTNIPQTPLAPGEIRILTPTNGAIADGLATAVVIQFTNGSQVELSVNGEAVDPGLVGRTETNTKTNTITQTWYGVSLQEGENTLTAKATTNGVAGNPVTIKFEVRGKPTKITLETKETRIPADGRSTATVMGQLFDKQGNLSNRNVIVTLNTSEGKFVGADYDRDRPGFQVQAINGKYQATLRSSLTAKKVRIRASTGKLEAFTQLSFETDLRPPIATGVVSFRLGARGTDFYRSFEEFLPADEDNGFEFDVRGAAFATGRIGDWLFTGAVNTARGLNDDGEGRQRLSSDIQFSEQDYPVYGDNSTSERLAESEDSLFLRFERTSPVDNAGTDFFMWGDYDTEEFALESQQFSALTRQLSGFKGNFNLGNFQITALYSNDVEGFQRDTIAPDGTSGFYFLSRRLVVPGSENVFIELEELNRPGTVIARESLSRGTDYDIDYDRGTLLFRSPILRTALNNNGTPLVRRIVATYQFEGEDNTSVYGGRVRYHFSREMDRESWIGATYWLEDQDVRDFELYGFDARIALGSNARLIAEYAHSFNSSEFLDAVSGSAYRLEIEGEIFEDLIGRAYFRSTDSGFSNNATTSFVPGQTRYGAQVIGRVSPTTTLRFQVDLENNFGDAPRPLTNFGDLINPGFDPLPGTAVNNSLTTIAAGVQQKVGPATLELDWIWRDRSDSLATQPLENTSSQLRSRVTVPITNKLSFQALNDLNLGSSDSLYPGRTLVGLDWKVMDGITMRLSQQFFSGGQLDGRAVTSLDLIGDYDIGENTSITGRFSVLGGDNGMMGQGAVGLNHKWVIAPGLAVDLAYEYVSGGDYFGLTGAGVQFAQPYAVGSGASSVGVSGGHSFAVGFEYTDNPDFKANARYEYRTSSGGDSSIITAGVAGKVTSALTALARYEQASSSNQLLEELGDTINLRVGLAYRDPDNDRFNALLRYDFRQNPSTIPDTILFGSGTGYTDHTFALESIYAPDWQWEFYSKFALRKSNSQLADDFSGSSTIYLGQLRATYRFAQRWDIAGEIRGITQSAVDFSEIGWVAEVGYYVTPDLRLAVGYSFGEVNSDRDFSGNRSAGGPYLGVTVKINEIFPGFGLQELAPPQHQESQVEAFDPKESEFEEDTKEISIVPAKKVLVFNEDEINAILSQHLSPIVVVVPVDVSRLNLEAMASIALLDLNNVSIAEKSSFAPSFTFISVTDSQLLNWYFSPQLAIDSQPEKRDSRVSQSSNSGFKPSPTNLSWQDSEAMQFVEPSDENWQMESDNLRQTQLIDSQEWEKAILQLAQSIDEEGGQVTDSTKSD